MRIALFFGQLVTLFFAQASFAWKIEALDTLDKVVMSAKAHGKRATMSPFVGVECTAVEGKKEVAIDCKDKNGSTSSSVDCRDNSNPMSFAITVNDPAKPEETRLVRINCK